MVVVAATLWLLFSTMLLAPGLGLPRLVGRAAAWLLALELVALMVWGYGGEGCQRRPCGTVPELARTAAYQDLPALTGGLLVLVALHPVRVRRARRARSLR